MEQEAINLQAKWLEQSVISISARIADATKMVQRSKEMVASSETVLIKAQMELKELYAAMEQENEEKHL